MRAEGIETVRRILCVFPHYTSSFGTFEHAYPLTDGVQAFMLPQGLLLIAARLPENWPVRFIDEYCPPGPKKTSEWAEAVAAGGMHIQRQQMNDICRAPRVGDHGPSVSACLTTILVRLFRRRNLAMPPMSRSRGGRDPSRPEQQVVLGRPTIARR
jgi:hypothetical protein